MFINIKQDVSNRGVIEESIVFIEHEDLGCTRYRAAYQPHNKIYMMFTLTWTHALKPNPEMLSNMTLSGVFRYGKRFRILSIIC